MIGILVPQFVKERGFGMSLPPTPDRRPPHPHTLSVCRPHYDGGASCAGITAGPASAARTLETGQDLANLPGPLRDPPLVRTVSHRMRGFKIGDSKNNLKLRVAPTIFIAVSVLTVKEIRDYKTVEYVCW